MAKTDVPSHWDDVFHKEFEDESDRASVILAATMIEAALETAIRARLVPLPSSEDALLEGANAPLSHFSSKIDMAYRLGIIPATAARDIHLIRRIRNTFAHEISNCTFSSPSVVSRVLELVRSQRAVEANIDTRDTYPQGVRGDFQMTASWILWWLWTQLELIEPLEAYEGDMRWTVEDVEASKDKLTAENGEKL
jgi:hypothetical protein